MSNPISRFKEPVQHSFDVVKCRKKLYDDNYKMLQNVTLKMFEWKNLPKTIPKRDLEFILQSQGYAIIAKDDKGDLYALQGQLSGEPDAYYLPTLATIANPALPYFKTLKIGEDCIIIHNDDLFRGLSMYIAKYAALLTSVDISFYWNVINSRVQKLFEADDDNTADSIKKVLDSIELGDELKTVAGKQLFDMLKSHDYTDGATTSTALKELIETKQYLIASFYIGVGLNANYNMKRESLNENEINADTDVLVPTIDNMFDCRTDDIEAVNEKYGQNIGVEISSQWMNIRRSLEARIEEQEKQAEMNPDETGGEPDEPNNQ